MSADSPNNLLRPPANGNSQASGLASAEPNVIEIRAIERERSIGLRAIDPFVSCVVEAPAGSGKTTLLIKRLLTLLAHVERPEYVVAITFTNKAAEEMRGRLLEALQFAKENRVPQDDLQRDTLALAQAVLQNDERHKWNLTEHPARLMIKTIDGLCKSLVSQSPVLSRAARLDIIDDAERAYDQAAVSVLEQLRHNADNSEHTASLLSFIDNQSQTYRDLSKIMLQKRDQWLHLFDEMGDSDLHANLNQGLKILQQDALDALRDIKLLSPELVGEILSLLRATQQNLPVEKAFAFPERLTFDTRQLAEWQKFADAITTATGIRKDVTKTNGFLAQSSEKTAMLACLKQLEVIDDKTGKALYSALKFVRSIPAGDYPDLDWQRLRPILQSLQMAALALEAQFRREGSVDFVQIARAANLALGSQDAPEELLLRWDYRIQHLLVDEFQDTSHSQWRLLNLLVSGFEPNDGRSVFLVGDPMQSIYGFREAQVGLFLQVANTGLRQVRFEKLRLKLNRRSQRPLVEWFNQTFAPVMGGKDNAVRGEVHYENATAVNPTGDVDCVNYHWFVSRENNLEARAAAQIIARHLVENPTHEMTVLAPARQALRAVAVELDRLNVLFEGIDLIALGEKPVIRDLMALTRAIVSPMDDVAALALLRAPWCGLGLATIHGLLQQRLASEPILKFLLDQATALPINDPAAIGKDPTQSNNWARIQIVLSVWQQAVAEQGSLPLADVVERAWRALHGVALLDRPEDIRDAVDYFAALSRWSDAGLVNLDDLERGVQKLYSKVNPPNPRVHLMTIHAAKGLEWPHVMLVGMGSKMHSDNHQLLEWQSLSTDQGERQLLIAPMSDKISQNVASALRAVNSIRRHAEQKRLWYVAATRAKTKLWLLGSSTPSKNDEPSKPVATSGLWFLWPTLGANFTQHQWDSFDAFSRAFDANATHPRITPTAFNQFTHNGTSSGQDPLALKRVASPLQLKELTADPRWLLPSQTLTRINTFDFEWASGVARFVGVVVHELFERVGRAKISFHELSSVSEAWLGLRFKELGLHNAELSEAIHRTQAILAKTVGDPQCQWIFNSNHSDSHFEWEWLGHTDHGLEVTRIDRSFIDEQGRRVIIDFKTSSHEGEGLADFLENERIRYRPQLERYANWLHCSDPNRAIRLGLYFPLLSQLLLWDYQTSQS